MTAQIWKYELGPGPQVIEMPVGAEPLHVAVQDGRVCVWCAVDTSATTVRHGFSVHGTGHDLIEGGHYIGTVHLNNGLVFHAFDHYEDPSGFDA